MIRPYYDYSRPRRFSLGRSWGRATRAIVVGTVVVAALELFLWNVGRPTPTGLSWWEQELFLNPRRAVEEGRLWQFATCMVVQPPGGVFTLISAVIILYLFGSDLERHLGSKWYVVFYGACGVGSGLAALLWYDRPFAGATGAVLGVATAYALIWPNRPVQIVVPIRTKWVVLALLVVPALLKAAGAAGGGRVPHLPELGGPVVALAVWALTRFAVEPRQVEQVGPPEPRESIDRRVDRILEKVHAKGVGSLTPRERRILEQASAELRHRSRRGDRSGTSQEQR